MNLQSSVNKILLVWIASIHDKRHKRHCVNEEIFLAQPEISPTLLKHLQRLVRGAGAT